MSEQTEIEIAIIEAKLKNENISFQEKLDLKDKLLTLQTKINGVTDRQHSNIECVGCGS